MSEFESYDMHFEKIVVGNGGKIYVYARPLKPGVIYKFFYDYHPDKTQGVITAAVHFETDVHATADNVWGFSDGEWIPYLTINYLLTKEADPDYQKIGRLVPMSAKDGAHYANNVQMDGPGTYKVTLRYESPQSNGYSHHVDKETGIPGWWGPFTEIFTFKYPQK